MDQITVSMTKYMEDHPNLKYIFFGGKGGVGKTVLAGTAALWSAKQGKKTLLASTNPVHSLSNLYGQDVFGKAVTVCDESLCYAFEIDTKDTIDRSKQEIREKINWFLKFADLSTKADDFIESATMNPAFEESAMFENMTDIMFKDEYDFYVFDTAPTANARRLLGMSKVYSLWVEKMLKSREEAKSLKELLSFSKKNEEDPLLTYLLGFKDRMAKAQSLLTDDRLTAFFFATLPESLPIAVITRFINWFYEFGIPVGGVIVNGIIQKEQVGENAAEFVRNRVAMQEDHMKEIWDIFGDKVRATIPLFETEIKGAEMLKRMLKYLFV
ncbi:MAG TPA: TRC40/GET3/ArsA family transport-energizing ATPase [Syntrophorhabdaceae bacterium]|jgi:arsenite-transporting ATPase|nr:TRC40/GET3/ArsA family transport-energizing ATPase [Syntrophorhabdaceae bacterium]HOF57075.1 TRC40/GET3/ArsA family transport-energizing ATPase [Syntrophorhabdaceae bacterium]HOS05079.1 TRC40/GET3/ArsA family transport-energizing ATPase [Syntrophorhabdaceae bacterium]HPL40435.1 TRC40/GET3/ArsA family transport-energizing ATPase [Syntrophorhabdaceae bacterium]HQM76109.1 TRC40/GET3/ArsA family transport-energizing ATPase [Syntrophorhabdaceae bacterium]